MSAVLAERPAAGTGNGGVPARRAVIRWAWRLFRREWRQQLLVLALITVAVAATFVGAAVATNAQGRPGATFGSAQDLATFPGADPHLATTIASLQHRFGRTDVIGNQVAQVPGSTATYDLRAQDPRGPFGSPMLSLIQGHYPAGPGQVAVTPALARQFGLKVGSVWPQGGATRAVTGIVQNPQSLLDEFALLVPGQVHAPTTVTVLFDAPGVPPRSIGPNVVTPQLVASGNAINPATITLALATVGMLLIALVSVGGFTVLAQRRLRALGMLGALGATDRNVRLVVRANGVVVGVAGTLLGAVLGLAAWLAYRPHVETSSHHLIAAFALPWAVIGPAMGLAVLATYLAAARPARAVSRIPVMAALSGRPAPPRQVRRSALPGLAALAAAFGLLTYSGSQAGGNGSQGLATLAVAGGFVALAAAVILLAPMGLALLGRIAGYTPVSARLALRDLARYRARSGSALAAISLGVLIAVIISVTSAARYANVLDYAGPNLTSSQLIAYTPTGAYGPPGPSGPGGPGSGAVTGRQLQLMRAAAGRMASALGSHDVTELDTTSASLQHAAAGRNWSGPVYVATPALLRAFGITPGTVAPGADILTMRPGLAGLSKMQLTYGDYGRKLPGPGLFPCPPGECLAGPVIQQVSALPSGTSAPNTVITEHAVRQLGLSPSVSGWLIQTPHPLTATQIKSTQLAAAAAGMTVQTRSSVPSVGQIIDWATVFGVLLALGVLAMSVGLIRSETASDLRTLAATGASGRTRRALTAFTAGALGLLGAVLGVAAGYVAAVGYFRGDTQEGGLSALSAVPVTNLLVLLVGLPLLAAAGGWLFAGREPPGLGRQPTG
ncbi:MAG TPA: FtsX-like permease family protein [Streptosporangiaceae bacterium]